MGALTHFRGNTNEVLGKALGTGVSLVAGDLCVQDGSGNITPASSVTWNTNLATTQADMKALFVGVALEDCPAGSRPRIATDGEFWFDLDSGTPNVGGLVGAAKAVGNALLANKVATAVVASSVGRVTGQSGTRVSVRIWSQLVKTP